MTNSDSKTRKDYIEFHAGRRVGPKKRVSGLLTGRKRNGFRSTPPILVALLVLAIFAALHSPLAHANTPSISWTRDYTSPGLFPWWSPTGDNLVAGASCGSCDGTGESLFVQHQASNGGGATGGAMAAFEDRNPTGAGPYYYCNGRCGFYVPNYGESTASLDISGTYHVLGYIGVFTNCFFCSTARATAHFQVDLWIYQDQASSLDATYYSTTLFSDDRVCDNNSNNQCKDASSYTQDQSFSIAGISLSPGHFYHVGLRFYSTVHTASSWGAEADAYGCFEYTSGNNWDCEGGPFSGTPMGASTCPSGIASPCYYVQWKSATYTLYEPDFSMSAPTPLSFNPASGTTATVTASSINTFSTPVSLSASAPLDPSLSFSFSPASVTPPSNGNAYSTMTISDSNQCDSGTELVNISGMASDGAFSTTRTTPIYVTLTPGCTGKIVDGSAIAGCGHNTNSCTATFSTSHSNDIVIVYTFEQLDLQTSCTFSVHDTAGLTWFYRGGVGGRNDGSTGGYRDQIGEFWARSPGVLTSDVITESILGCASTQYGGEYNGLQVFGINGANYNNPFDPNSSLPGTANGYSNTPSATMSTSSSNDMVISAAQQSSYGTLTPGSGFTGITANTEYKIVSSQVTNFSVTFGDSATWYWEQMADAVQ